MDVFLQYLVTLIPAVVALFSECGVVIWAKAALKKAKESKEFKAVAEQNKKLVVELREMKRLNRELLTKIDRIARNQDDPVIEEK